jgi:hypothetical protein
MMEKLEDYEFPRAVKEQGHEPSVKLSLDEL